jgi:hypothetical protein
MDRKRERKNGRKGGHWCDFHGTPQKMWISFDIDPTHSLRTLRIASTLTQTIHINLWRTTLKSSEDIRKSQRRFPFAFPADFLMSYLFNHVPAAPAPDLTDQLHDDDKSGRVTFVEGHVPDHLEELGDRQFDFVYTRLLLSGLAEPKTAVECVKQLVRCRIDRARRDPSNSPLLLHASFHPTATV